MEVKRVPPLTSSHRIWLRALDQLVVSLRILAALWTTAPKPDVVVSYSPPLLLTIPAVLQKWLRRSPYVLTLHDLYPQNAIDLGVLRNPVLIWVSALLESLVYRNATRIVVSAPASERILTGPKGIPSGRVHLILNPIDLTACQPGPTENTFRKREGLEGRFVVLYAGLMGLAQDLTSVLEVARQVQNDPDWVFVLAGDGPCTSKWAAMAEALTNVRMVGPLSYDDYYEALRAADVCLVALASVFRAPGVPGKVSPIMAAGRPIVASVPVGNDTRGLLSASESGIAVDPDRPDELLAALQTLKSQPDLRTRLGENATRFASTHFEARAAVKRLESILDDARNAHAGRQESLGASDSAKASRPSGSL